MDATDAVLQQILERPESQWSDALAATMQDHPALAAELQRRFDVLRESGLIAAPEVAPTGLPPRLGEFTPVRVLGEGGMGIVYEARQERLGHSVALKVMRPGNLLFRGAKERFRRESEAIARLSHPGIVSVFTVGEDHGVPFFAMELLRGASLDDVRRDVAGRDVACLHGSDFGAVVARRARATEVQNANELFAGAWVDVGVAIGVRLAQALAHAHAHGIVHRDVKPSNAIVTPDGRVVLLDFGLATADEGDRLTRTGTELGSLPYLAPEVLNGQKADARSDQYALALLLYELLGAWHPFLAPNPEATRGNVLAGDAPPLRQRNAQVSRDLAIVLAKAMDADPARRYGSIAELGADLDSLRQKRPILARAKSPWRRMSRWCQRHRSLATALVLGFVLTVGTPTAFAIGIAGQRDRARAAEAEQQVRTYEANIAAASAALQAHDALEAQRRLTACPVARRGLEWRHLEMALDSSVLQLHGCVGAVTTVAVTDDARLVAAADVAGNVLVWQPELRPDPRRLGTTTGGVEQLAFLDDDRRLLIVSNGSQATVLDLADGASVAERQPGTTSERLHLAGQTLLVTSGDWLVESLDANTLVRRTVHELEHQGRPPLGELASADSRLFAPDLDGLRCWDLLSGRCTNLVGVAGGRATRVVANGDNVAVLDGHGRPFVGNPHESSLRSIDSTASGLQQLVLDPHGELLAGFDNDRTLLVWRLRDGHRLATMPGTASPTSMALAARRRLLATGSDDGVVRLWSPFGGRDRQLLPGLDGVVSQLTVAGDKLLSASREAAVLSWNPRTGEPLRRFGPFPHWVNALAVAPDGDHFFATHHGTVHAFSTGNSAQLRDIDSGSLWIHAMAAAPAGDVLLLATENRGALLLDDVRGAVVRELKGHDGAVLCGTFAPDGTVFTGGMDGRVMRWPRDPMAAATELSRGRDAVSAVVCDGDGETVFSAEGTYLRARRTDGAAMVWEGRSSSPALCLQLLHDGTRLVSGHADGSLVLWEPHRGIALLTVRFWTSAIRAVAVDIDGQWIAAGGDAPTIAMLRAETQPLTLREAMQAADAKRNLMVAFELHDRLALHEDVLAAIDRRTDLDAEARRRMRDDDACWSSPSWSKLQVAYEIATDPGQSADTYRWALRVASAAMSWHDEVVAVAAVALAHARLGAYAEALRIADEGLRSQGPAAKAMEPCLRAARAMALLATGHRAEAVAEREQIVQAIAALEPDAIGSALLAEVEAALRR